MKLSQALKIKNRLAGEIAQKQQILQRENARRNDNVTADIREETYNQIRKLSDELGELKAKICKANIGIYAKLERMAEMKAHIAFITNLPKREGQDIQLFGRDQEKVIYTWDSFIPQQKCDTMVAELQQKIGAFQDEIDIYNSSIDL